MTNDSYPTHTIVTSLIEPSLYVCLVTCTNCQTDQDSLRFSLICLGRIDSLRNNAPQSSADETQGVAADYVVTVANAWGKDYTMEAKKKNTRKEKKSTSPVTAALNSPNVHHPSSIISALV